MYNLPTRSQALIVLSLLFALVPLAPLTAQPTLPAKPPTVAASTDTAESASPSDPSGAWSGSIELPNGTLDLRVELSLSEEGWTGAIDIPQQGASGLALSGITVEGTHVRFSIRDVPGDPTFDGTLEGNTLSGLFTQGRGKLSFRLERTDEPAPVLRRPQTPQPPFPYRSEEITVDAGSVTLAGTLTLPEGEDPFPGVVLLTGSGAQDRDETLMGHKPFWVLADHLSRHGIAVLRLDDRGVGGSSGELRTSSLTDLVSDARAAVAFLAAHPEVAEDRVGLLGHSEGGMVAPVAAVESDTDGSASSPAFLVLLAGPGLPGSQVLIKQAGALMQSGQSVPESLAGPVEAVRAAGIAMLAEGADEEAVRARMRAVAEEQARESSPEDQLALKRLVEKAPLDGVTPLLRDFLAHDPRPFLHQVKIPVLALNGDLDLQVDAHQNLGAIEEALQAAGNEEVALHKLSGLNHLFQHATTGSPLEYRQIEETISPEVLELIAGWIGERFAVEGEDGKNGGLKPAPTSSE